MTKKILIILGKVILGIVGAWIALLLILEICLSSAVVSRVINSVATEYIDGTLDFTKARVSFFKRFPSLYVEIEDFCLTYPADRFDQQEKSGAQGWLLHQGCGESADTLASFKSFKTSVRLFSLIQGKINIPYMNLDKPRIFAHSYDKDNANWNIFKFEESSEEEVDSSSTEIPPISLGKISLTNNPHVVYTDSQDTLFALLRFKKFDFKGRIANRKVSHNSIGLEIDSLIAAGRMGRDTIAFGLQSMKVDEKGESLEIHADARTSLATASLGRLDVPIRLDGSVSFPQDTVFAVNIERFNADIATIPIDLSGNLRFYDDKINIKADAAIEKCNINGLLKGLAKNIVPEADKISTNALLTLTLHCDGDYVYEPQRLPEMELTMDIPQSKISHTALSQDIRLALNLKADVDKAGKINAKINKTDISASGIDLNLSGKGKDLLGNDPELSVKGSMVAILEDLAKFLPDSLGVNVSGSLIAEIEGDARMSQLDLYRFSEAKLTGKLQGHDLNVQMPADEIKAHIHTLDIQLGPEDQKSRRDTTITKRMLAIRGHVDSLNLAYGNLKAHGNNLSITAKSEADALKGDKNFHYIGGRFAADKLAANDGKGSRLFIKETSNSFHVAPDKENAKIPILTFTSRNKSISAKVGVQRAGFKDATIIASATLNKAKKAPRPKFRGTPKGKRPAGMQEDDFKKEDIDIRLDEELAKYFKEWDFRGSMKIDGGFIASPYFPLKNRLNGFSGRFNSNEITINEFSISSGKSDISADGKLSGLRRMLAGRKGGMLTLNLNVNSENIDADELIRAYNAGLIFDEEKSKESLENISDEEYTEAIIVDTAATTEVAMGTVVVPGNINATLNLNTKNIKYTGLQIDSLKATAIIKDRCIQLTDTEANSNVGDVSFDGFYASRSKKDIKAGFSVDFKDITAEKVIALMPAIDTLMPILKSFEGMLNCEIAATTQLDTNMNLIMPSINGILRITGDSLAVKNNKMFQKLARRLLFKNKKEGHIDHMSVEGIISDNVVEVFPFVLTMDRYTLALSGIQNLDMSYKYHVSLIKSPFLIRLGLDIYGDDFDNMKFRIGRPKYKSPDVPVFSKVIDDTKLNLVTSIEDVFKKGVNAVIKENNGVELIRRRQKEMNYVRAVDQKLEELSDAEKKKMEEEEAKQEAEEQAAETTQQEEPATEKPE